MSRFLTLLRKARARTTVDASGCTLIPRAQFLHLLKADPAGEYIQLRGEERFVVISATETFRFRESLGNVADPR